ncbi:MAG: hemerythrin domain-containing protein [Candidatus Thorarchaeota archaeon]|nr:hemerythrin domain-containing protein [Candidatus Thorarchaeota archaeon]
MVEPIGPLMIEHRLIERMISEMKNETERIRNGEEPDLSFIETAVDFIRTYADACHHGKEEDILFRDLKSVQMDDRDEQIMNELIEEHKWAREKTSNLVKAKEDYLNGDEDAVARMISIMEDLTDFYPKHIEKEDKDFFRATMKYLDKDERDEMLEEEYEFDREFIHALYEDIVSDVEKRHK